MTKIAGLVLRAERKETTARFYSELGLETEKHSHGGPKHYEVTPISETFALEIYARFKQLRKLSDDALILEVDSIDDALVIVNGFRCKIEGERFQLNELTFLYVTDPDDRLVLLMEKS